MKRHDLPSAAAGSELWSRRGACLALGATALVQLTGCKSIREELDLNNRDDTPLVTAYLDPWRAGAPRLQVDLPKGSKVKMESKPDAAVYYVTDEADNDTMGIYVGGYPVLFSEKQSVPKTSPRRGTINGKAVDWICWKTDESPADLFHSEVLVYGVFPGPEKPTGIDSLAPVVHIFIIVKSKKREELYQRGASTLTLEKKK